MASQRESLHLLGSLASPLSVMISANELQNMENADILDLGTGAEMGRIKFRRR